MAFFGVTQLGPQSFFNQNLLSLQNYSSFTEEDFQGAFTKHAAGAASMHPDLVQLVLDEVFMGRAAPHEVNEVVVLLSKAGGDVSFSDMMVAIATVAGGKAATAQACTCAPGEAPHTTIQ